MFCFRLQNSRKSIISGFSTFHHHDFSRYKFWKQINLQKAVKHNERKKLISSINSPRYEKTAEKIYPHIKELTRIQKFDKKVKRNRRDTREATNHNLSEIVYQKNLVSLPCELTSQI